MAKLVLTFLQLLIATSIVHTKTIPSRNELKYIGSFLSRSSVQGGSPQLYDESNYHISDNAASWNSALGDCKVIFGANASLVAIESEEEWAFLVDKLSAYGTATDYWTSGLYNPSTALWRWYANNVDLPPFAPWAVGYPSTPSTVLRVLIKYNGPADAYWSTVSNTQLHRYICEIQVPTIALPCYQSNDLAIVLDSSGSIGYENFEKAKVFVERLASAFSVYASSRLSFITYSSDATTHIDLTNSLSRGTISSTILNVQWEARNTATNAGVALGTTQLTSNLRGVPLNMVVLTDGESNAPKLTVAAAQAAISSGIRTFAVGITQFVNPQELLEIAGNDPNRVFTTENFDELINLLAPLSLKVCPS